MIQQTSPLICMQSRIRSDVSYSKAKHSKNELKFPSDHPAATETTLTEWNGTMKFASILVSAILLSPNLLFANASLCSNNSITIMKDPPREFGRSLFLQGYQIRSPSRLLNQQSNHPTCTSNIKLPDGTAYEEKKSKAKWGGLPQVGT